MALTEEQRVYRYRIIEMIQSLKKENKKEDFMTIQALEEQLEEFDKNH